LKRSPLAVPGSRQLFYPAGGTQLSAALRNVKAVGKGGGNPTSVISLSVLDRSLKTSSP